MLTVAQTTKNISNFTVGKSSLQEMAPLVQLSGDQEVQSKIWSLPDYLGELTALCSVLQKFLSLLSFIKLTLSDRLTGTLGLILLAHWTTKLVL